MMAMDVVGLLGGACVIVAMCTSRVAVIKWLLLAGAIILLTYGVILNLLPIVVLNTVGVIVGCTGVIRFYRLRGENV